MRDLANPKQKAMGILCSRIFENPESKNAADFMLAHF